MLVNHTPQIRSTSTIYSVERAQRRGGQIDWGVQELDDLVTKGNKHLPFTYWFTQVICVTLTGYRRESCYSYKQIITNRELI